MSKSLYLVKRGVHAGGEGAEKVVLVLGLTYCTANFLDSRLGLVGVERVEKLRSVVILAQKLLCVSRLSISLELTFGRGGEGGERGEGEEEEEEKEFERVRTREKERARLLCVCMYVRV